MTHEVKIEGADGAIMLNDNAVTEVIFSLTTPNSATLDHSDNIVNRLEMKGIINDSTMADTLELAKWSQEKSHDKVYKNVDIKIKINEKLVRRYNCENMFCLDYYEVFHDNNQDIGSESNKDVGTWRLILVQKNDKQKTTILAG